MVNKTLEYDGFGRITKVTDRLRNEYQADYKLLETKYTFKEKIRRLRYNVVNEQSFHLENYAREASYENN